MRVHVDVSVDHSNVLLDSDLTPVDVHVSAPVNYPVLMDRGGIADSAGVPVLTVYALMDSSLIHTHASVDADSSTTIVLKENVGTVPGVSVSVHHNNTVAHMGKPTAPHLALASALDHVVTMRL